MKAIVSILTAATCGAECWYAKQDVCRCSCGGKNHGVMLTKDGTQPERTARIDGFMYRLEAVGPYTKINDLANRALTQLGWKRLDPKITYGDGTIYHFAHYAHDTGSAIRAKPASGNQLNWPEVKQFANCNHPYILWVKTPMDKPVWCEGPCARCDEKRIDMWAAQLEPDPTWGF